MQLPQGADALLLGPYSFPLLVSSTNLGNLTATYIDGEVPLYLDRTNIQMILPSHAQDFPSLYRLLE